MSTLYQRVQTIARSFPKFTEEGTGMKMRPYQLEPARAILNSIKNNLGLSFVVMISRQSGKDELAANLKAYLLTRFQAHEASIVEVNPTYKPQTINAIMRLENRLSANLMSRMFWKKRSDFMRMVGKAKVSFLSGDAAANVVGATASLLLIINEAQDVDPAVYDKKFAPMVASTNATRVFFGTAWTSDTLLHRELRNAQELEKKDGIRRAFVYTADDVRKVVPAYGHFIDGEIAKNGRQHPLVKTQYFCETIDAQAGMFNTARLALMKGDQPAQEEPIARHIYALTIDVAGQDEAMLNLDGMGNPGRDSIAYTLSDIDLSELETLQAPIYRFVKRDAWQGISHIAAFGRFCQLIDLWQPMYIIIDATGVGEGLWAMLARKYGARVIPIKVTQQEKSERGYGYLAIIETGRARDCCPSEIVRTQYNKVTSEIMPGPAKTMRWGVKDGTRDQNGELVHDDFITSDSFSVYLDKLEWMLSSPTLISEAYDPLADMDGNF